MKQRLLILAIPKKMGGKRKGKRKRKDCQYQTTFVPNLNPHAYKRYFGGPNTTDKHFEN